ncbi:MAG: chromate resistance protein ChrB domain-containing protein [Myxococcales bacterium]
MKWVTRRSARVNRIATAWLVRRFIDAQAVFLFVEPEQVAAVQDEQGATGFDAPGARYPHRDQQGRCSFEALAAEHRPGDGALQELARIVHCADFPDEVQDVPEAAGLRAISRGFPLVARDDHDAVEKASFLYDALYAALQNRAGAAR